MQAGAIDAVHSDERSVAAPVDGSIFGGYFHFATRYSLDMPVRKSRPWPWPQGSHSGGVNSWRLQWRQG